MAKSNFTGQDDEWLNSLSILLGNRYRVNWTDGIGKGPKVVEVRKALVEDGDVNAPVLTFPVKIDKTNRDEDSLRDVVSVGGAKTDMGDKAWATIAPSLIADLSYQKSSSGEPKKYQPVQVDLFNRSSTENLATVIQTTYDRTQEDIDSGKSADAQSTIQGHWSNILSIGAKLKGGARILPAERSSVHLSARSLAVASMGVGLALQSSDEELDPEKHKDEVSMRINSLLSGGYKNASKVDAANFLTRDHVSFNNVAKRFLDVVSGAAGGVGHLWKKGGEALFPGFAASVETDKGGEYNIQARMPLGPKLMSKPKVETGGIATRHYQWARPDPGSSAVLKQMDYKTITDENVWDVHNIQSRSADILATGRVARPEKTNVENFLVANIPFSGGAIRLHDPMIDEGENKASVAGVESKITAAMPHLTYDDLDNLSIEDMMSRGNVEKFSNRLGSSSTILAGTVKVGEERHHLTYSKGEAPFIPTEEPVMLLPKYYYKNSEGKNVFGTSGPRDERHRMPDNEPARLAKKYGMRVQFADVRYPSIAMKGINNTGERPRDHSLKMGELYDPQVVTVGDLLRQVGHSDQEVASVGRAGGSAITNITNAVKSIGFFESHLDVQSESQTFGMIQDWNDYKKSDLSSAVLGELGKQKGRKYINWKSISDKVQDIDGFSGDHHDLRQRIIKEQIFERRHQKEANLRNISRGMGAIQGEHWVPFGWHEEKSHELRINQMTRGFMNEDKTLTKDIAEEIARNQFRRVKGEGSLDRLMIREGNSWFVRGVSGYIAGAPTGRARTNIAFRSALHDFDPEAYPQALAGDSSGGAVENSDIARASAAMLGFTTFQQGRISGDEKSMSIKSDREKELTPEQDILLSSLAEDESIGDLDFLKRAQSEVFNGEDDALSLYRHSGGGGYFPSPSAVNTLQHEEFGKPLGNLTALYRKHIAGGRRRAIDPSMEQGHASAFFYKMNSIRDTLLDNTTKLEDKLGLSYNVIGSTFLGPNEQFFNPGARDSYTGRLKRALGVKWKTARHAMQEGITSIMTRHPLIGRIGSALTEVTSIGDKEAKRRMGELPFRRMQSRTSLVAPYHVQTGDSFVEEAYGDHDWDNAQQVASVKKEIDEFGNEFIKNVGTNARDISWESVAEKARIRSGQMNDMSNSAVSEAADILRGQDLFEKAIKKEKNQSAKSALDYSYLVATGAKGMGMEFNAQLSLIVGGSHSKVTAPNITGFAGAYQRGLDLPTTTMSRLGSMLSTAGFSTTADKEGSPKHRLNAYFQKSNDDGSPAIGSGMNAVSLDIDALANKGSTLNRFLQDLAVNATAGQLIGGETVQMHDSPEFLSNAFAGDDKDRQAIFELLNNTEASKRGVALAGYIDRQYTEATAGLTGVDAVRAKRNVDARLGSSALMNGLIARGTMKLSNEEVAQEVQIMNPGSESMKMLASYMYRAKNGLDSNATYDPSSEETHYLGMGAELNATRGYKKEDRAITLPAHLQQAVGSAQKWINRIMGIPDPISPPQTQLAASVQRPITEQQTGPRKMDWPTANVRVDPTRLDDLMEFMRQKHGDSFRPSGLAHPKGFNGPTQYAEEGSLAHQYLNDYVESEKANGGLPDVVATETKVSRGSNEGTMDLLVETANGKAYIDLKTGSTPTEDYTGQVSFYNWLQKGKDGKGFDSASVMRVNRDEIKKYVSEEYKDVDKSNPTAMRQASIRVGKRIYETGMKQLQPVSDFSEETLGNKVISYAKQKGMEFGELAEFTNFANFVPPSGGGPNDPNDPNEGGPSKPYHEDIFEGVRNSSNPIRQQVLDAMSDIDQRLRSVGASSGTYSERMKQVRNSKDQATRGVYLDIVSKYQPIGKDSLAARREYKKLEARLAKDPTITLDEQQQAELQEWRDFENNGLSGMSSVFFATGKQGMGEMEQERAIAFQESPEFKRALGLVKEHNLGVGGNLSTEQYRENFLKAEKSMPGFSLVVKAAQKISEKIPQGAKSNYQSPGLEQLAGIQKQAVADDPVLQKQITSLNSDSSSSKKDNDIQISAESINKVVSSLKELEAINSRLDDTTKKLSGSERKHLENRKTDLEFEIRSEGLRGMAKASREQEREKWNQIRTAESEGREVSGSLVSEALALGKRAGAQEDEYQQFEKTRPDKSRIGSFARKVFGGFGLMYLGSIANMTSRGIDDNYKESLEYQEMLFANGANLKGAERPYNQALINANKRALLGPSYSASESTKTFMLNNPGIKDATDAGLAGLAGYGATTWMLGEAGVSAAAAGPWAVAAGLTVAAGNVGIKSYQALQDPNNLGYKFSRAMMYDGNGSFTGKYNPLKMGLADMAAMVTGETARYAMDDLGIPPSLIFSPTGGPVAMEISEDYKKAIQTSEQYGNARSRIEAGNKTYQQVFNDPGQTDFEKYQMAVTLASEASSDAGKSISLDSHARAQLIIKDSNVTLDQKTSESLAEAIEAGRSPDTAAMAILSAQGVSERDAKLVRFDKDHDRTSQFGELAMELSQYITSAGQSESIIRGANYMQKFGGMGDLAELDGPEKAKKLEQVDRLMASPGSAMAFAAAQEEYHLNLRMGRDVKAPDPDSFDAGMSEYTGARDAAVSGSRTQLDAKRMQVGTTAMNQAAFYGDKDATAYYDLFVDKDRQMSGRQVMQMERLLAGDPMMYTHFATTRGQSAPDISLPTIGNAPFMASTLGYVGNTDIGLNGRMTGMNWGSTSLASNSIYGGYRSGSQNAADIWGSNWASNSKFDKGLISSMIDGVKLDAPMVVNGQTITSLGGMEGAQIKMRETGFAYQLANFARSEKQMALEEKATAFSWSSQDAGRDLSDRFQEWQFGFQQRQLDVNNRNFGENMGMQRQQTMMSRSFAKEDWSYADNVRNLQWGWKQEDFAEESRFMTGRTRKKAERQNERETIMHNMEGDKIDRDRKRQQEVWMLEDKRFDIQRKQFAESMKMQQESLDKQREYFEARKNLEKGEIEFQRAHYKQQIALQKESMAAQKAYMLVQQQQQRTIDTMKTRADLTIASMNTLADGWQIVANRGLIANGVMETLADTFSKLVAAGVGANTVVSQSIAANIGATGTTSGISAATGGSVGSTSNTLKKAHGGRVRKGDVLEVGEIGPERFIPDSDGVIIPSYMKDTSYSSFAEKVSDGGYIASGGSSSSAPAPVVNVYIGNEKIRDFIVSQVKRELA